MSTTLLFAELLIIGLQATIWILLLIVDIWGYQWLSAVANGWVLSANSPGTAEEKVPATIQDIAHWPIPGIVVIDGKGFSANMPYLMSTGKV